MLKCLTMLKGRNSILIGNDQEVKTSDSISCPLNQKGNKYTNKQHLKKGEQYQLQSSLQRRDRSQSSSQWKDIQMTMLSKRMVRKNRIGRIKGRGRGRGRGMRRRRRRRGSGGLIRDSE